VTTIHALNKSISQMTDQEASQLIQPIRKLRFVIPERRIHVVAAKREGTAKANSRVVNVLQSMSSEDRAALIKMLEEQS
jgi:flagellar motility protein MotE (MotC chaperone)